MYTDAHERAHDYIGASETAADNAANNELSYYNFIADISSGYEVSSDNNTLDLNIQNDWNNKYKQDELLLNNTAKANAVAEESKANDLIYILLISTALVMGYSAGQADNTYQDLQNDPNYLGDKTRMDMIVSGALSFGETNYDLNKYLIEESLKSPEIIDGETKYYYLGDHYSKDELENKLFNIGLETSITKATGDIGVLLLPTGGVSNIIKGAKLSEFVKKTVNEKSDNIVNSEQYKNTENKIEIKYEQKIKNQMPKRGWDETDIENTIKNGKQESAMDTRHTKTGTRNNSPATKYTNPDGSYVVRNNNTGDIVQISNKNKPGWIDHGTKIGN